MMHVTKNWPIRPSKVVKTPAMCHSIFSYHVDVISYFGIIITNQILPLVHLEACLRRTYVLIRQRDASMCPPIGERKGPHLPLFFIKILFKFPFGSPIDLITDAWSQPF